MEGSRKEDEPNEKMAAGVLWAERAHGQVSHGDGALRSERSRALTRSSKTIVSLLVVGLAFAVAGRSKTFISPNRNDFSRCGPKDMIRGISVRSRAACSTTIFPIRE